MKRDYTKQKIAWEYFLERRNAFFYVCMATKVGNPMCYNLASFKLTHQIYHYENGLVTFYVSEKEMRKVEEYLIELIKKKDPLLKKWEMKCKPYLEKEKQLYKKFEQNLGAKYIQKNYEDLMQEIHAIFLHLTYLSFIILTVIDNAVKKGQDETAFQDAIELFKPFRKRTSNTLHDTIFKKIWEAAATITKSNTPEDYAFFTPDELGNLFRGQEYPSQNEIEQRKKQCIFYDEGDGSINFNYDPNFLKNVGITPEEIPKVDQLKGTVAFKGMAQGKICIVNKPHEMHKCQPDSILISMNTTPALMPALSKCKAIVTDDGGLTCHASIISRELQKPCIVGTRFSTKIFKDGDLVLVDAEKGIIKKL